MAERPILKVGVNLPEHRSERQGRRCLVSVHPTTPEEDEEDDIATVLIDRLSFDDEDLGDLLADDSTPQAQPERQQVPLVATPAPLDAPLGAAARPGDDVSLDVSPPPPPRAEPHVPAQAPASGTRWLEVGLAAAFVMMGAAGLILWAISAS